MKADFAASGGNFISLKWDLPSGAMVSERRLTRQGVRTKCGKESEGNGLVERLRSLWPGKMIDRRHLYAFIGDRHEEMQGPDKS